jgi:hypothetical protein
MGRILDQSGRAKNLAESRGPLNNDGGVRGRNKQMDRLNAVHHPSVSHGNADVVHWDRILKGGAMTDAVDIRKLLDDEHLKILSICYYIYGAFTALLAFIPGIYVILGIVFAAVGRSGGHDAPPAFLGWILIFVGLAAMVFMGILAGLKAWTGWCIARRKHETFVQVVAAVCCLGIPWGTALGIFTFIVFSRPAVRRQFMEATSRP